ncbi:MAG: hypothetical protein WCF72_15235, partial [Pseudolabrys sp.]
AAGTSADQRRATRSGEEARTVSVVKVDGPLWPQNPARPDLNRHGAKLSRVAFVGCRLEADTVAMFDALTVQLCDVEK